MAKLNVDTLLNEAEQLLVDFSDSDITGNLVNREPPTPLMSNPIISNTNNKVVPPAVAPVVAPVVAPPLLTNNTGINNGSELVPLNDITGFSSESLDSPGIPTIANAHNVKLPSDPVDSASSDPRHSKNIARSERNANIQRAQRNRQIRQNRLPNGPPSKNGQPTRSSTRPSTRPPTRPPTRPANRSDNRANRSETSGVINKFKTKPAQSPSGDTTHNLNYEQLTQSNMSNDELVSPKTNKSDELKLCLKSKSTKIMGYSVPTSTLYFIIVLAIISIGLYFLTKPKKTKKSKKKTDKIDDEEDRE